MLLSSAAISRQADALPHGSMFGVSSRLCTFRARRRARGFLNTAAKAQQVGDKPEPPAAAPARRQAEPHLECIGTAMEVECRIVSEGPDHVPVASPEEEVQAMTEAQQNTPHTGAPRATCCRPAGCTCLATACSGVQRMLLPSPLLCLPRDVPRL